MHRVAFIQAGGGSIKEASNFIVPLYFISIFISNQSRIGEN